MTRNKVNFVDVWYSNPRCTEVDSLFGVHDSEGNWLLAFCLRPLFFMSSDEMGAIVLFLVFRLDGIDPA